MRDSQSAQRTNVVNVEKQIERKEQIRTESKVPADQKRLAALP
jgi:hypothetical protein